MDAFADKYDRDQPEIKETQKHTTCLHIRKGCRCSLKSFYFLEANCCLQRLQDIYTSVSENKKMHTSIIGQEEFLGTEGLSIEKARSVGCFLSSKVNIY